MKKFILTTLLAGATVASMGAISAQAGTLDAVNGKIEFVYNAWDAAQVAYNPALAGTNGMICNDVSSCNAASSATVIGGTGTAGDPFVYGSNGATGTNNEDDTWGVAKVTSILDQGGLGNPQWQTTPGEVLFVYFHGFKDEAVQIVGDRTFTYSTGGYADVYVMTTLQADGLIMTANQAALESALGILGINTYLELSFVHDSVDFNEAPCSTTYTTSTLCGDFDTDSLSGKSIGYAKVEGGDAQSKYEENFQFIQNFVPCGSGLQVGCLAGTSYNTRIGTGNIRTTALPEPGALGLLGLGLVGLGLIGRRRNA